MADSKLEELKNLFNSNVEFWQPTIIYKEDIKLDKRGKNVKSITFPFTPPNIFKSEKESTIFASIYMKAQIHEGNLPEEVFLPDGKMNEDIVKVYNNKVILTAIDMSEDDKD